MKSLFRRSVRNPESISVIATNNSSGGAGHNHQSSSSNHINNSNNNASSNNSSPNSAGLPGSNSSSSSQGLSFSFLLPTAENLAREPPCGLELLEYANGDIYEGEVNLKGHRHGSSNCCFSEDAEREYPPNFNPSQPAIKQFTGKWFSNMPCIDTPAVIQYSNGDRYCGAVMAFTEELLDDSNVLSEYYNRKTVSSPSSGVSSSQSSNTSTNNSNSSNNSKKKKSPFSFNSTSEANNNIFGNIPSGEEGLPFIMKHGEGELHYANGSKYNGSFLRDMREGFGVMIDMKNDTEYYGNWKDNEKEGFGTMIFKDGTVYEGEWKAGAQGGRGVLRLPNGDKIIGEWSGNNIKKATYEKGTIQHVNSKCQVMLLREEVKKTEKNDRTTSFSHVTTPILAKEDLVTQRKWDGLFASFTDSINYEKEKFANSSIAKFIEEKKSQEDTVSPMSRKSIQDTLQTYLDDAMVRKLSKITYDNVTQIVHNTDEILPINGVLSTATNDHVLSRIISKFVNLFNWKYHQSDIQSTVAAKYHIPHALDDFHSFVIFLFEKTCFIIGTDAVVVFGHKRLLYELKDHVLSRIYNALFTIYKFCYQEQDNMYKFKTLALSTISMRELGVKEGFIPTDEIVLFENPYDQCIKKLRQISTQNTTAHAKLDVLVQVGKELITAIDFIEEKKRGKISDRGADDTLPVYLYVFIQAQIPNVFSTFKFLLDFMDEKAQTTEQGYRFSVFENAIQYIPMIDSSIRDTNGILVPTFVLEDRLESCVKKIRKESKEVGDAPRLLWMSSLFIVVGSTLSEQSQTHAGGSTAGTPNVIPITHKHHKELLNRYYKHAERILKCISLQLEAQDLPSSVPTTPTADTPVSPREQEEDWTPLQKKMSNADNTPRMTTKQFSIVVEQVYPSHIYFKLARKLEELLEEH
ncbi:hypothetical protein C9374_001420 [Naegleria lovaniensis]|uniref:VPS9 domain-containing protein n=1 Tax=Naegleria lovaniensis TaxID=51637 RepID=A0AA88GT04_NAELO|nr:uncharacterized protein C9374_001420 [Naegleria lovaniensis]KAG2387826.1 hypothetical protein C9374_001420 [Naegleria lovaniensis]